MVKIAMSRPARVVTASRPFDHVYDPIYTASSVVDQQKTLRRSMVSHEVPSACTEVLTRHGPR